MDKYRLSLGFFGEEKAAEYLNLDGYKILERNYRCEYGEIDIIASRGKTLCFVEVKTKSDNKFGAPIEAVEALKRRRMYKTAKAYMAARPDTRGFEAVRFDAFEVFAKKQGNGFILCDIKYWKNIIEDASAFEE